MRYIISKDGRIVATIERGKPDLKDLKSRGELIVESGLNIPINVAKYKNGKIMKRKKTQEELKEEEGLRLLDERNRLIVRRMRKIAEDQLIKEKIISGKDRRKVNGSQP